MTGRAIAALKEAEYILGNESYLAPLAPLLAGKEVIRSSMGKEVERAKLAVELAGKCTVAMVSGGDPGVYGMAGIVLEVAGRADPPVKVVVIPGVTAATAAASLLGSPLSGDFAVVSLSDLLTPLGVIEERLRCAFAMGVPVVLYNPRSRGRPHNFARAVEIALRFRDPATPVGIVRNAYREGEEVIVTTLAGVGDYEEAIDMHSTVIIGGLETMIGKVGDNDRTIITPRGYGRKYVY
jgi:precorrin-3B C17-methyltransferase